MSDTKTKLVVRYNSIGEDGKVTPTTLIVEDIEFVTAYVQTKEGKTKAEWKYYE